jgi:hypothetical protein
MSGEMVGPEPHRWLHEIFQAAGQGSPKSSSTPFASRTHHRWMPLLASDKPGHVQLFASESFALIVRKISSHPLLTLCSRTG